MPRPRELDARDQALLHKRCRQFWTRPGPRVGDYVDFADGVTRRVSHVWDVEPVPSVQTSDSGSFYLGEGYCSFSGGLEPPVPVTTLTEVGPTRTGWVWFFHHNEARADNGVYAQMPFQVYQCSLKAKKEGPEGPAPTQSRKETV